MKEKTIVFDVKMLGHCGTGVLHPDTKSFVDLEKTPIHMTLELLETQNLNQFAETIIHHRKTLNWDMDHLYHFSMDNKAWQGVPSRRYSLPLKDQPKEEKSSYTKLSTFNFKKRNVFILVYDYGDDIQFKIKVKDFGIADNQTEYPHVLKKPDLHPKQYPQI